MQPGRALAAALALGASVSLSPRASAAWPPAGTPIRADITRDTWVSNVGAEADGNNGGADRLKTKSIQECALLDIDPVPLRGRVITGATLHFRVAGKDPQRRVTVSTLASDWGEGASRSYNREKGAASFRWAKQDTQPWAWPGSDLTAVMNGQGHTIWRFADATPPDANGWQVVAVEPRVVAARVAGISYGFVLFDDTGSEYQRDGEKFTYQQMPNRFIYSKDAGKRDAPYLTVYLGDRDAEPPDAVAFQPVTAEETRALPASQALVRWTTPADHGPAGTLGFLARYSQDAAFNWDAAKPVPQYLVPLAGKPGEGVPLRLRDVALEPGQPVQVGVRAVDAAGNVGPVASTTATLSNHAAPALPGAPLQPFTDLAPLPKAGDAEVFVLDELDKVHPASGQLIPAHPDAYKQANHLWSAARKLVRLQAAKNEFVAFQVVLAVPAQGVELKPAFTVTGDPAGQVRAEVYRFRHIPTKAGPLPDPLLPVTGPLDLPAAGEDSKGQKWAAFLVDLYVPHTAAAGLHPGTLTIQQGGQTLQLTIDLTVWDFTLPDHLSFIPEMNCYNLPGEPGSAANLAYYRLAQVHRTCLNRLGYNWRGEPAKGCTPDWDGKQAKWDAYDRRFGPLLDGSAFRDLPRGPVPVEAFYLPLNENWPMDVHRAFRGGYWADAAFPPEYWAQLADISAQFARHFRDKGWNDTLAEFYLNNKVYDKEQRGWTGSAAPWIFDEPVHTQDFWALRQYASAFHQGVAAGLGDAAGAGRPKLAFRCDISRPQWQRDLLDGVLDVNVVGGPFRQYQRVILDRKERGGEVLYNYGSSNGLEQSNVQPAAWCLDTWCLGGDGVLPWQTIGTDRSWTEADPLSLFYPGPPGAPAGQTGPVASVRLKSYRRGQQDVEYLVQLAAVLRQPRWAMGAAARQALRLKVNVQQRGEDAGFVDYGALDPAGLWALRTRIGQALDQAKPTARPQRVDLRPPPRNPKSLPDAGYVTVGP